MNDMKLVKYDTAKKWLEQAHSVDEVKEIRDRMVQLKTYARLVNDHDVERWAVQIRLRAEAALGERLKEAKQKKLRRGLGGDNKSTSSRREVDNAKTLKDLGLTYNQSSQYQQMADIPKAEFEKRLEYVTKDPRTASTKKMLVPIPPPEPEWSKRENVWTETLGWLEAVKYCEPIDELRKVKPRGGLRDGIREELATVKAYVTGLVQLEKEGVI